MNFLQKLEWRLIDLVAATATALFVVMLVLAIVQIVLRFGFNSGMLWADPLTRRLVLWVGLLGAVLATKEEKHFQLDVLTRFLLPAQRRALGILSAFVCALVCLLLAYASVSYMQAVASEHDPGLGNVPLSVVSAVIPLAFVLIALEFVLRGVTLTSRKIPREDGVGQLEERGLA
jgi:TRAP-type C4-dicarboxylate transport system permease small subunit